MKKMRRSILAAFCLVCCAVFGAFPVGAASGVKALCENVSKTKTVSADVTGDGKKDTIRLKFTGEPDDEWIRETRVDINGKKALSIKDKSYYYSVSLRYIRMSKSKTFLQIISHTDNDDHTFNRIYRYDNKKKKLVPALDLYNGGLSTAEDVVKATGKEIQIRHRLQPEETGWINWKFTYTYKKGIFKLKSSTASVKSSLGRMAAGQDDYGKYFEKNQFIAAKPLTFYTDTSLNKTAFTAQKQDKLTLKKIKVSGSRVYLQFQKGKKTGWRRANQSDVYNFKSSDPASTGWFYGVFNRLAG